MSEILNVKNLCFSYYKKPLCIKDATFSVQKGENYLLFGISESGKTTFLKVVSGFQEGYFGRMLLNGKEIKTVDDKDKNFSLIFTEPVLLKSKSIRKNIDFLCETIVKEKLSTVELKELLDKFKIDREESVKVKKLSLFEQRKLALCRSYLKNADIVFVDDQFKGLSKQEAEELFDILKLFFNNNCSVIVVLNEKSYLENAERVNNFKFNEVWFLSLATLYKYNDVDSLLKDAKTADFMNFSIGMKKNVGYISVKDGEYYYVEENIRFHKFDKKYKSIFDKLNIQENGDEDVWLFMNEECDIWEFDDTKFNALIQNNKIKIFLALDLSRLL